MPPAEDPARCRGPEILIAVYHMLATSTSFRELGEGFLDAEPFRHEILCDASPISGVSRTPTPA